MHHLVDVGSREVQRAATAAAHFNVVPQFSTVAIHPVYCATGELVFLSRFRVKWRELTGWRLAKGKKRHGDVFCQKLPDRKREAVDIARRM